MIGSKLFGKLTDAAPPPDPVLPVPKLLAKKAHSAGASKIYIEDLKTELSNAYGGASFYASSSPDGLEKVAEDIGFIETAKDNSNADTALADYGVKGVENERLSVGAAGVIGVIATGAFSGGLFLLLRRKKADD